MSDREIKVFTARLSLAEYTALRQVAHAEKRSMNDVLSAALRHYMVEHVVDDELQAKIQEARDAARAAMERFRDE